jgi:hypothetical protein
MSAISVTALCRQLIAEAEAIIKYTENIECTKSIEGGASALFDELRLDELEHIQKLTLELTEALSTGEEEPGGEE